MTFRRPVNVQTRSASAFTLLEMLLALSMVVTLLFVMTRVFDDLVDARRRIEQDSSVVEGCHIGSGTSRPRGGYGGGDRRRW